MSKKMQIARNISGVEDLDKLDEANQDLLAQQRHTSSFKQFLKHGRSQLVTNPSSRKQRHKDSRLSQIDDQIDDMGDDDDLDQDQMEAALQEMGNQPDHIPNRYK